MGPWRRAAACSALTIAAVATACSSDPNDGDRFGTPADAAETTGTTVPGQRPVGASPAPDIPTVGVGERTAGAGYELVVHDVTVPAPAPDGAEAPSPGRMFMAVDVELVNRTGSARDATYLRFEVVDPAGARYPPSPAGDNPPTGWIPADAPRRGVQLYEVPLDATGLVLTLRPDLVSGVAAAVRLR
jgi:hypothetical protein